MCRPVLCRAVPCRHGGGRGKEALCHGTPTAHGTGFGGKRFQESLYGPTLQIEGEGPRRQALEAELHIHDGTQQLEMGLKDKISFANHCDPASHRGTPTRLGLAILHPRSCRHV